MSAVPLATPTSPDGSWLAPNVEWAVAGVGDEAIAAAVDVRIPGEFRVWSAPGHPELKRLWRLAIGPIVLLRLLDVVAAAK